MSRSLRSFLGNPLKLIEITETLKTNPSKSMDIVTRWTTLHPLMLHLSRKQSTSQKNLLIVFLALKLRVKHKDLLTTKILLKPWLLLLQMMTFFFWLQSIPQNLIFSSLQHEQGHTQRERESNQCWELTIWCIQAKL